MNEDICLSLQNYQILQQILVAITMGKEEIKSKKGHCIICHRDEQELSDEHVIPEAIGGYYHIYCVCKECNSKLGDHVDKLLLNHWFIKAARHEKGLKGYSGKVPNPLIGEGSLSTGEKVRVEQDDMGKLFVRLLPSAPEVSEGGKSVKIQVDVNDEKIIPQIQEKILKRHQIDSSKVQIISERQVVKIDHPEIKMQFAIDLRDYKFGLLKIAYEFAADKISGYLDDPIAIRYAGILLDGNPERLNEVFFEGDAIVNSNLTILESIIDRANNNRHLLLLFNLHDKLYCLVKLFDKFCQIIRMSDDSYGEDGIVMLAINDFVKNECVFYSAKDLINATRYNEYTTFELEAKDQAYLNEQMNYRSVYFACDKYQDNLLFDCDGNFICTESILLLTLEKLNLITKSIQLEDRISVTYQIPFGYHYLCIPDNRLLMIKDITKVNVFQKI